MSSARGGLPWRGGLAALAFGALAAGVKADGAEGLLRIFGGDTIGVVIGYIDVAPKRRRWIQLGMPGGPVVRLPPAKPRQVLTLWEPGDTILVSIGYEDGRRRSNIIEVSCMNMTSGEYWVDRYANTERGRQMIRFQLYQWSQSDVKLEVMNMARGLELEARHAGSGRNRGRKSVASEP